MLDTTLVARQYDGNVVAPCGGFSDPHSDTTRHFFSKGCRIVVSALPRGRVGAGGVIHARETRERLATVTATLKARLSPRIVDRLIGWGDIIEIGGRSKRGT